MTHEIDTDNRIVLNLPGKPEYVSLARLAVASIGNIAKMSMDDIDDLKVAVSEACTNALQHGCEGKNNYEVIFELAQDKLLIDVIDNGRGYALSGIDPPELSGEQTSGFGLYIIEALTDEVTVKSSAESGTHISMVKFLEH